MAIYDYLTPFEDNQQKPILPMVQPTREQQPEQNKYSGKPSVNPDSQYFDVSAAWYNHPGPFTFQTVQSMTQHPVLLRHNQTGQRMTTHPVTLRQDQNSHPKTPHPVLLRHEMPELSDQSSSEPALSQDIENLLHCSRCGLLRAHSGSNAEAHCCHMCADIKREGECPNTNSPNSRDVIEARGNEANGPIHQHRRHSLFYDPSSRAAGEGSSGTPSVRLQQGSIPWERRANSLEEEYKPLKVEFNLPEVESMLLKQESTPFEQESTPLEQKSTPLEQESTPLEQESTPLEQESTPLEQEPTPLEQESTPLEQEPTPLEQEPTPLEQESTPLEHTHDYYENPYFPGAEEQLSRVRVKREEAKSQCRVQKAREQLWFGNTRLSSTSISEFDQNGAERAHAEDRPKGMTEVVNEEYFYGKYT